MSDDREQQLAASRMGQPTGLERWALQKGLKVVATKRHRYRSAVTGRWVTAAYAKRYPHLTVRETTHSKAFNRFLKGETK